MNVAAALVKLTTPRSWSLVAATRWRSFSTSSRAFNEKTAPFGMKDAYVNLLKNFPKPPSNPEALWEERSQLVTDALAKRPTAHTYSGRTVKVYRDRGEGGARAAMSRLNSIMIRNNVKKTLISIQRHEKRGVKRRRLESQRWRNRFADEVRQRVELVDQIRRRGV